jgi:imidazole glycerol-phosphate synthase subunit HisH
VTGKRKVEIMSNTKRKYLAVIDYGMGNIHSVLKGIERVGVPCVVTDKPGVIKKAAGIVLPGVGAFRDAMSQIRKKKLYKLIKKEVENGKPIIGICLGMQLLLSYSTEFGKSKGFGFIKGKVIKFRTGMKVPHMGWNEANIQYPKSKIMKGIKDKSYFYFVHSYYAVPTDPKAILTKTRYGNIIFTSAVEKGGVYGFQFHPEKSGEKALKIYKNFYEICKISIK